MQVRSNAERARFNWRSGAAASAIKCSGLFVLKRLRAIAPYWLEIRLKLDAAARWWVSFMSFWKLCCEARNELIAANAVTIFHRKIAS